MQNKDEEASCGLLLRLHPAAEEKLLPSGTAGREQGQPGWLGGQPARPC